MHEWSLVQGLISRVEAEARAHAAVRVSRVEVRVGELAGVDAGLLAKAFESFGERTACEGAVLSVTRVPAAWRCRACRRTFAPGEALHCSACDAPAILEDGGGVFLDRIELEVP